MLFQAFSVDIIPFVELLLSHCQPTTVFVMINPSAPALINSLHRVISIVVVLVVVSVELSP